MPDLAHFLTRLLDHSGDTEQFETEIYERFQQTLSVMSIDLCGFTRTTRSRGIVRFLLMIARMERIARPIVSRKDGTVIETTGDNLLCVFGTANAALAGSFELLSAFEAANKELHHEEKLHASVGIGFGQILNDDHRRIAGDQVNLASKLAEDLAGPDEILLTEAAREELSFEHVDLERLVVSVAGLDVACYRAVARRGG